jgi:hypothetical protein
LEWAKAVAVQEEVAPAAIKAVYKIRFKSLAPDY